MNDSSTLISSHVKVDDKEYQFPGNVSKERLKIILKAKHVIRSNNSVLDKEDLVALFKKFIQPLPRRQNQLRRCSVLRRPRNYAITKNDSDKSSSDKRAVKGNVESDVSNQGAHSAKLSAKPVKLKRHYDNEPDQTSQGRVPENGVILDEVTKRKREGKESNRDTNDSRETYLICEDKRSWKSSSSKTDHTPSPPTSSSQQSPESVKKRKHSESQKSDDCSSSPMDREHKNESKQCELSSDKKGKKRRSNDTDSTFYTCKEQVAEGKKKEKITKITWP